MPDIERWRNLGPTPWGGRLDIMASLIPQGSSVLDVGAGDQSLRGRLPARCRYQAVDCVATTPETLVADLNRPPIMLFDEPFDVAVLSGVVEYLADPERTLRALVPWARRFLISYVTVDREPNVRSRRVSGWVNHLSSETLAGIFDRVGLEGGPVARWGDQTIYDLRRR